MSIAIVGDIHGDFAALARIVAALPEETPVIQVGDFGYWPELRSRYVAPARPVLFIDGNHDHVPLVASCEWPHAEFVPRGDVRVVDGRRVLFLGGATSVDRKWRPRGAGRHAWFDEEVVSDADAERAIANAGGGVDLMVTHTPPDWMIRQHFSPLGLMQFEIDPRTWRDPSAERIEYVWRTLGEPPLYCGHMHRSVSDGACRILDINEVVLA